jgi:FecR protein
MPSRTLSNSTLTSLRCSVLSFLRYAILATCTALLFAATGDSAWADSSYARVIRVSLVQGHVRFTRDYKGDPLADQKAVWEDAVLNLPIRQDYALATDEDGRAEVEFENGAMAFLSENSVVEFYDLSLNDGAKTTRLVLRQGTASFYVNPASEDYFSVTGGDFTVEATSRASFRLDNFDDGSVVNVRKGHVSVVQKKRTVLVAKGQSLSVHAADEASATLGQAATDDDFDRWVSGREDSVLTATNAAQQYVTSPYYTSGLADLYTYGSWYPVSGYGNCWRPYGVGYGWSPFDTGGWFMDPWFGWGFIGYQPWGWLPYHYGGWIFDPVFGWLWSPGFGFGGGFGYGYIPYRPVTGIFVHSRTGLLGIVPTHPLDARGKTPLNLTKGLFPVADGKTSALVAANGAENWKVMKAPPQGTFVSHITAAAAPPERISRSIASAGVASRGVIERNSSIVYDPAERRFVNGNSSAASAARTTEGKIPAAGRGTVPSARAGESNVPAASRVASASRAPSPRTSIPSAARNMTPPPAPRSYGGGGGGSASSWGGGSSGGGRGASSPAASAPAPHASAPAGGGGRPH